MSRSALLATALLTLACATSCATASPDQPATLGEAPHSTAGLGSPSAPTAPSGTPPTLPPKPAQPFPESPRSYAEATVGAWAAGQLTRLAGFTTPEVYEQLVEIPGTHRPDWAYLNCTSITCRLRNSDGDTLTLTVNPQQLGLAHAAVKVSADLTTYPTSGEQYAYAFARAWKSGNVARMAALSKPTVVATLNQTYPPPAGLPVLAVRTANGGAGLLIATVHLDGKPAYTLHIGTTLLGTPHAIVGLAYISIA